jgi:hypothetical protein
MESCRRRTPHVVPYGLVAGEEFGAEGFEFGELLGFEFGEGHF